MLPELRTIVLYHADVWGSCCPVIRVAGPAKVLGLDLIRGNEWEPQTLIRCFPEAVSQADLIVIQRDFPRYMAAYEQVMARARAENKPVIYELDDILCEAPPEYPFARYYGPARFPMLRAFLEADAVTTATPLLLEYLEAFNPRMWLLPNYLNDQLWRLPDFHPTAGESPVTIGYMGGHSHKPDVELIAPTLEWLIGRYGDRVRLKFWGSTAPPALIASEPNVEWIRFDLVDYAEFAAYFSEQQCDIFVAPLVDHRFNRLKSPIKFLEYSALGVPGVYSRIAPYEAAVTDGYDGFLASSREEWQACLVRLMENPALRSAMGRAAQQTVRQNWLLSTHAHRWQEAYDHVRALPRRAQPDPGVTHAFQRAEAWHQELDRRLADREQALTDIQASMSWQLLEAVRPLSPRVAPAGSRRERLAIRGIQRLRAWIQGRPSDGSHD